MLGEPVAQNGFGVAKGLGPGRHRVHLGSIHKVDAALAGAVKNAVGGLLIDLLPKCHGAQANGGNVQAALAELDFVHGRC